MDGDVVTVGRRDGTKEGLMVNASSCSTGGLAVALQSPRMVNLRVRITEPEPRMEFEERSIRP